MKRGKNRASTVKEGVKNFLFHVTQQPKGDEGFEPFNLVCIIFEEGDQNIIIKKIYGRIPLIWTNYLDGTFNFDNQII